MIKTTKQKGEFGMKRTVYEAPVTELFRVELEGNFCASADVENPNKQDVGRIDAHEVNTGFTGGDFSATSWDEE
jgi:hypothetical protein